MRERFSCKSVAMLTVFVLTLFVVVDRTDRGEAASAHQSRSAEMAVRSSPQAEFATRQSLDRSSMEHALRNAVQDEPKSPPSLTDIYITMPRGGGAESRFRLEQSGSLWSESESKRYILSAKAAAKLRKEAQALRARHYGDPLTWKEAKQVVPMKSVFTIQDLETGLSFRVQRRAGRDHADVQPISKADSTVMKQIYGEWSWKRKAILVLADGKRVAASMNGMPHGGDGIPDNGFSGHFCVHFLDSTTHKSEEPDPAHQLMVHKAAGDLRPYFQSLQPAMLARSFVDALNHREAETVRMLSEGMQPNTEVMEKLTALSSVRMNLLQSYELEDTPLTAAVDIDVTMQAQGQGKQSGMFKFKFCRLSPLSPWQLEDVAISA